MEIKKLIQIIIETVEKFLFIERLKVSYLTFQNENENLLNKVSKKINGNSKRITLNNPESFNNLEDVDILFIDSLPKKYISKIALGLIDDDFSEFISNLILKNKTIVILNQQEFSNTAPITYKTLFNNYFKILKSYGFIILNNDESNGDSNNDFKNHVPNDESYKNIYDKNVLTRGDLLTYTQNGCIFVKDNVLITDMAKDTAKDLNIKINLLH